MNNILEVNNITKTFRRQDQPAVENVSFQLQESQILALVGASGSGKTTILRILAGLEQLDSGEIHLAGQLIASKSFQSPAENRGVGMVFQNHALFPHLNIEKNIAFGLRKESPKSRRETVADLLQLVGLTGMNKRFPHELSGGERQRIALARALAPQPRLLLLDEPFSSLDMRLKQSVRDETREILAQRGTTVIFVTHDTEDALAIADQIVVMKQGQVQQIGAPQEVYYAAANPYVATFFGSCNFLPFNRISALDAAKVSCHFGPPGKTFGKTGIWIRPADLRLAPPATNPNGINAKITRVQFAGTHQRVFLTSEDGLNIEVYHQGAAPVCQGQEWSVIPREKNRK